MDARGTTDSGQQFVTPMTEKLKAEWDRECVRYSCQTLFSPWSSKEIWLSYKTVYTRWLAKSARPLSLCENDKPFRAFIKKITYGRYQPPCENTAYSELLNLVAETESNMRNVINRYQHEGLMVSISTDIWGENGKLTCLSCNVILLYNPYLIIYIFTCL